MTNKGKRIRKSSIDYNNASDGDGEMYHSDSNNDSPSLPPR